MFTLDTYFHILTFSCKGANLSWGISRTISDLKVRFFDKDGYVEFDTNVGLEGIDILDDSVPERIRRSVLSYLDSAQEIGVSVV